MDAIEVRASAAALGTQARVDDERPAAAMARFLARKPADGTTLACPQCGTSDSLATIEHLAADACTSRITRLPDGGIDMDYTGETVINWDSASTVGVTCRACRWYHEGDDWANQLVSTDQEPSGAQTHD